MLQFWVRALLSGLIIAAVAAIARRSPALGALVASLPLISLLAMIWLWHDTHDVERVSAHVEATLWYVIPSLPMFLLIPWLLRSGVGFWVSLLAGCALTMVAYLIAILIASRFGIRL